MPPDLPVFPRDLEMELALNAAPPHLRDGASVLVFERSGSAKARDGQPMAAIQRQVEEGFKSGTYRAPKPGGVAYMLSPLRYRIDDAVVPRARTRYPT